MSSVPSNRPFGEIRTVYSGMGQAKTATFRLIVETQSIDDLVDFIELVYETEVKISLTDNSYKLSFACAPHRTESGVWFAISLFEAELLRVDVWH